MLNKVQLIGNVGHDLEVRSTPTGVVVTSFNLATNRRYRDASGERQTETAWHRVVLWGKSAHNAGEILRKGSLVYVEGRLKTRSWEDRDSGATRYRTEVVGLRWQLLGQPDAAAPAEAEEVEPDLVVALEDDADGEDAVAA
jgi:single-strand DNA-binding protein